MATGDGNPFGGIGGNQSSASGKADGGDGVIRIDPADIDAAAGSETASVGTRPGYGPNGRKLRKDGTERAARGGGGGNASGTTTPKTTFPVEAMSGTILGMHAILSTVLKTPELALDPREAAQLGAALANLQQFYPVSVTAKALAWANLLTAGGMIYGTRIAAIAARKAKETRERGGGGQVIRPDFRPRPGPMPQPQPAPQPTPFVVSPDGDPVAPAPQRATEKPQSAGDAAFANTPPELI